ncbi:MULTISPECIES: hypothetical protein [unclassified Bradyrhizobium]|uniref:hypothetical protein n=1 Tax=unclassified Bradyrhizobium TaxID=2631580 RepID=UPI0028E5A0D7|nr:MULTISPECIES: hypothetical protein [unclassified Bradyrhizobium]
MIYLVVGLVVAIGVARLILPIRYAVHASKAGPLPEGVRAEGRWLYSGFVRDEQGKSMDLTGKFIGHAAGSSMVAYGIPAGATFIGELIQADEKRTGIPHGEIIVVDGAAEFSETGFRLRCLDRITPDGQATFLKDGFGRQPRPRPASEIYARVTHVIENDRLGNAEWAASLLNVFRWNKNKAA